MVLNYNENVFFYAMIDCDGIMALYIQCLGMK